jgi:hypothetical protein
MTAVSAVSVNVRAAALVGRLIADAPALKIGVTQGELGETLIDAGNRVPCQSVCRLEAHPWRRQERFFCAWLGSCARSRPKGKTVRRT